MSYEIIKHIKVDEEQGKVLINHACNNVRPRTYSYFECESLGKILKEQGRMALDIEILKEYESGNFQKGNNRYTSALKRLKQIPEYQKFDWRISDSLKYEVANKLRKTKDFDNILKEALISKFPKEKYVISKQYCTYGTVYAYRQTKLRLSWTKDITKAKIFHYKQEAEDLKKCFIGGDKFVVEQLKTNNDCSKTVTRSNAYEVWQSRDKTWTWYVLKKWQKNDNKQYARWFCDVVTPMCPEGEMGDVYVEEIKQNAIRIN